MWCDCLYSDSLGECTTLRWREAEVRVRESERKKFYKVKNVLSQIMRLFIEPPLRKPQRLETKKVK